MPVQSHSRSPYHASRLFSRHRFDVRARLEMLYPEVEPAVIHARTFDLSQTGAGLTLTRELPLGAEVQVCLRLPEDNGELRMRAVVVRCQGFRVGLQFVQLTTAQRLQLFRLCGA